MSTPSSQAPSAYQPGDVFARRYAIEHLLGAGFQAEVYAVKNKHTGAARALKLLKARHQSNAEYVQRFLQEAEQLTSLSHPNLVRVFDAGIEDTGEVWMLMELLEGRSLRTCMQELGSVSVPLAVFIVREVSRAIALAHEQDVMHRDVKPENIMVTPDGVKVLDFGISKVYGSAVPTTDRKLRTLGTIAYMAPEQVASLPPTLSVDVYALGLVLYELLAGQHPFQDVLHDALEVGKRQMFHTPPMITTRIVGVPDYVETILNGALEKNRAHRTSMAALAEQLDEAFKRFEREAERGEIAWHPRPVEAPHFENLLPKSSLTRGAPGAAVDGAAGENTPAPVAEAAEETPGPYGTAALDPSAFAGAAHPTPRPARGTVKMDAVPSDFSPAPPLGEPPPPRGELPSAAGGPRPELSGALRDAVMRQAQISRPSLTPLPPAPLPPTPLGDGSSTDHGSVLAAGSPRPQTVSGRALASVLLVGVPLTVLATWAWLDQGDASHQVATDGARPEGAEAEAAMATAGAAPVEASAAAPAEASAEASAAASASAADTAAPEASAPAVATAPKPPPAWTGHKPTSPPASRPPPKPTGKKSGRVF